MSWVLVILIIGTFYDYYQVRQFRNGTVQLNPNGAGGYTQMSEDWIRQVITNLPDNHPTKNILREAVRSGKIKTYEIYIFILVRIMYIMLNL